MSGRWVISCLLAVVIAGALDACGGGGGRGTPNASSPTVVNSAAAGGGSGTVSGPAATVTVQGGYQYRVSAGAVATATTEGEGGLSPQNAPPGKEFLQTTVRVINGTDRQEPLDGFAASSPPQLALTLAIPMVDAGSFGAMCEAVSSPATAGRPLLGGAIVPAADGYCLLQTAVGSISGPNADAVGPVEMNPGATETVVAYASSPVDEGTSALQDVAVFAGDHAPAVQLLGPRAPALTTASGAPVFATGAGVLFLSRGPIQTAADPTAGAGRVQFVTHLTITNPTPGSVDVSGILSSGITGSASSLVSFTVPVADLAGLGVSQDNLECGKASGAPADDMCLIGAYFSSSADSSIPAGGSEVVEVDGRDLGGAGFAAAASTGDLKVVFGYTATASIPGPSTEIPQGR